MLGGNSKKGIRFVIMVGPGNPGPDGKERKGLAKGRAGGLKPHPVVIV
jgi:hypothetical protein